MSVQVPGRPGLQRLGSIHSRNDGFDLNACLPELARLLEPRAHGMRARPVGVSRSAWLVDCPGHEGWMVKKVSVSRRGCNIPTELENCDALVKKFPELLKDPRLAFPHSTVEIKSPRGERLSELLISRRCPGEQLGSYLAQLDLEKIECQERLEKVCAAVGELLADFHRRYKDTQHTDFHLSNVLYDASSDTLSIVDLEGMGAAGITDDVEKFERVLTQLAGERYAEAFRLRYIALAPKMERSSTKSTQASSADLLYPPSLTTASTLPRGSSFRCLSALAVPETGFDPEQNLVTLAWLVSPTVKLTQPKVRVAHARRKAWTLYQNNQQECWYLKQVTNDPAGAIEQCEQFIRRFPEALGDRSLAFPHCVIPLQMSLKTCGHVFVATCPCNTTLEQYFKEWREAQKDEAHLEKILFQVGLRLSQTLAKYSCEGLQLRPGSVLYDGEITFADFSWSEGENLSAIDRLCNYIQPFAGDHLTEEARKGYAAAQRSRRKNPVSCFGSPRPNEVSEESSSDEEAEPDCCTM